MKAFLEIHYYFRTKGNARCNDLSQLTNTLSNQDFAGLDDFIKVERLENLFCMLGVARKLN